MKTHLIVIGTVALLGTSLLTTSFAANSSEYLHLTRHRDSNGNLRMAPRQHKAEPSVMQKMVMPSQLKTFERQSTDWGMSVQDVKENEPIQSSWDLQTPVLAAYEKRVAYHTQIEGIAAALTYTFYDNHLGQAKYVFEPQHKDAVEYVQDFRTVKGWISQSYGSPILVQEIWLDTLYQYDQSLWGQAVKRGHLVMVAEWKNPGTDIVLVLDGGNDEIGLIADFSSTTFVVPVSLDLQGQEESVEEVIEDTTAHEAVLPTEQNANMIAEELSIQDLSLTHEGHAQSHPETEVASQGSVSEIDEFEQRLNKEFPVNETVNKEFPVHEVLNKDFPLTEPLNKAFPIKKSGGSAMESGLDSGMHDAVSKEMTAHEVVLPTEQNAGFTTEELSVQDLSLAHEGQVQSQPATEVTSQAPISEIDEFEQMLNKDFPVHAPLNKDFPLTDPLNKEFPLKESVESDMAGDLDSGMHDAVNKEAAVEAVPDTHALVNSEEIDHASMLEHPIGEEHLVGEGTMSQRHLIEPSVDAQMSEKTMEVSEVMPLEPSSAEQSMEAHSMEDHADVYAMDEHANHHVVEVETELEPQHL